MACSKTDILADSTPPISKIVFFCQALISNCPRISDQITMIEEAHEVLMTVAEQLEQKGLQISCQRFPWQGQFSPPCVSTLLFLY